MSMLAFRAYGVVRGDVTIIRWIASDRRATDTAVGIVFIAMLVGTLRHAVTSPYQWLATSAFMATIGLAIFASTAWLIGKALEGTGSFSGLVRTSAYAIIPISLGVLSPLGMAVGLATAFLVMAGVVRVVHSIPWSVAALTALFPTMVVMAGVGAIVAGG